MAQLSFSGLQPVSFAGKECKPKLDAEIRLRIQTLKVEKNGDLKRASEVLSEAFPDDKEYVKDFIQNQMSVYEVSELQVYLAHGAKACKEMNDALVETMKNNISKASV